MPGSPVLPPSDGGQRPRRVSAAGLVVAAALLGTALLVWVDLRNLPASSTYGLGPEAMPIVVAAGLGLLGLGNLVLAFRGEPAPVEPGDARAVFLILGGLAALVASIAGGGGFIVGTAILFAATAAAFGRRAIVADLLIGLVLAVGIYLLFTKLLTLSLPTGPLERLI